MFEPKFKLGDLVCSDVYDVEKAVVIGLKAYSKYHPQACIPLGDWKKSAEYDYDLLVLDGMTVVGFDAISECYLELYNEGEQ